MATSCLCDICNCGRHRCVEEKTSIYQKVNMSTDMPTEYTDKYPIHTSYEPRPPIKPHNLHVMKGRLNTIPTSLDHYQAWQPCKREPVLPVDTYHLRTNKFGGKTVYQEQFHPKPPSTRELLKPETMYVMKERLDTIPTSKDHYQQWGPSKREPILPHDNYHLVTHKFGGKTSYQEQYEAVPPGPRKAILPFNNLHLSRAAFSGDNKKKQWELTTYGSMFGPKKINVCPASFSTPPGYVFTECDDRGHRCFLKVAEE